MAARAQRFARLSLDYPDHPKIASLSDEAFRTHVEMILYSARYQTDGFIAKQIAKRWLSKGLNELLENDAERPSLVALEDGSYQLHGYGDMQETKAEIDAKRIVLAANGRKGGLARKQNAKQIASAERSKLLSEGQPGKGSKIEAEEEEEKEERERVRASTLPPSWEPSQSHYDKGTELGIDVTWEATKFKDNAEAKGLKYKNWSKAFHTWLNRAKDFQPQRPPERVDTWKIEGTF